MNTASFFPTWMFSRHIPSGNKKCVRTEHKTDHNDHDLSHGYLCKKNSNLCPLCALLSNIWTIKLFCWTQIPPYFVRWVFSHQSSLSITFRLKYFPTSISFDILDRFSVILSISNFPRVELLWYYGYYFLSNSRYF